MIDYPNSTLTRSRRRNKVKIAGAASGLGQNRLLCHALASYILDPDNTMSEYLPPKIDWVREHVEAYEGSGGTKATTLRDTGMPCIIVTHKGGKTGAVRKIPLMRVKVGASYVLIGSMGGQPKNPVWVYNLRAHPDVEIRDATEVTPMVVREVVDADERAALWAASAEAFPPYNDYQAKTDRVIPVFVAEPATKA